MASSMNAKGAGQAFETPFNISDYVTFEFDVEVDVPYPTSGSNSPLEVTEPFQGLRIADPYFGFDDAVDSDPNVVSYPLNSEIVDAFNFSSNADTEVDVFGFVSPTLLSSDAGAPVDDFAGLEPSTFAYGVEPDVLQTQESSSRWVPSPMQVEADPQSPTASQLSHEMSDPVFASSNSQSDPSRWAAVSPEMQKQLNEMYADQLALLSVDPYPPPVLYLPAEQESIFPLDTPPTLHDTRLNLPQTAQTSSESPATDVSTLSKCITEVSHPMSMSNGSEPAEFQPTVAKVPNADSSNKKRTFDDMDSDAEPAPKRSKRNGRAMNRRMQRLQEEMEDTKELARGYEVSESMRERPVRKGARRSYVGLG